MRILTRANFDAVQ